jgi:hypothetical protein
MPFVYGLFSTLRIGPLAELFKQPFKAALPGSVVTVIVSPSPPPPPPPGDPAVVVGVVCPGAAVVVGSPPPPIEIIYAYFINYIKNFLTIKNINI